jgi:hypothetical protein
LTWISPHCCLKASPPPFLSHLHSTGHQRPSCTQSHLPRKRSTLSTRTSAAKFTAESPEPRMPCAHNYQPMNECHQRFPPWGTLSHGCGTGRKREMMQKRRE